MKRINEGDWVLCPGSKAPVKVVAKESRYWSGIGMRATYWVDLGPTNADYLREDLTPAKS